MHRVLTTLLIALVALPTAAASSFEGSLTFHSAPSFAGEIHVDSSVGGIDMSDTSPAWASHLSWDSAEGRLYSAEWYVSSGRVVEYGRATEPERVRFGAGQLTSLQCAAGCTALLLSLGGGHVGGSAPSAHVVSWSEEKASFWAQMPDDGAHAFLHEFPAGSLLMDGDSPGRLHAAGELVLFLKDALVSVRDAERASSSVLDTRSSRESVAATVGVHVERVETRHVVLELHGARLAGSPAGARLYAPAASVTLDGELDSKDASGTLTMGTASREFTNTPVRLVGLFDFETSLARAGEGLPLDAAGHVLQAELHGEASEVWVGGVHAPTAKGANIAVGSGIALVLTSMLLASRLLVLPLYSRICRASVMGNPNRRAIWEALGSTPGSSVSDLTRESGLARVVVRHHLTVLESQGFAASRTQGRRRLYFPSGEVPDDPTLKIQKAMSNPSRLRLAAALVDGPQTRLGLAERTGLSPRLVSHHLRQLEAQKLVEVEGEWRRSYHPTRLLHETFEDLKEDRGQNIP